MNAKALLIVLTAALLATGCSSNPQPAPATTANAAPRGTGDSLGYQLYAKANPGIAAKPMKSSDIASVPQD